MVEKDDATKKPTAKGPTTKKTPAKKMNVYLISFVITLIVFFLGMFVGLGIERFIFLQINWEPIPTGIYYLQEAR